MSFIKRMSVRAIQRGEAAADLDRKRDRVTQTAGTLTLLIAPAVWYFFGLGWASIPLLLAAWFLHSAFICTKMAGHMHTVENGGQL